MKLVSKTSKIMKTFKFNHGEVRLESQIGEGKSFETACILWGCFDKETGNPLPYTVSETTKKELKSEQIRLSEIREDYAEVCEKNEIISRGNERVINATTINEFLNAY